MARKPAPAAAPAADLFAGAKSPDEVWADAAIAKMAKIATTAALWIAVDAMTDRRGRMDRAASDRITAALHRRYEQLTGQTLAGAPIASMEKAA